MKQHLFKVLMTFSVVFLVACGDDENDVDVTAPVITVSEPVYGEAVAAGGTLHFDAVFEDNKGLATYNVSIHNNFDGHTHGRIDNVQPWTFSQSYTLTGRLDDDHQDITVATDATAGPYHLTVEAIDEEGNSTSFADGSSVEMEIWITNDEMAHIHFHDDMGMEVTEFDGVVGQALSFYGEVEDESGTLDHVMIMVGHMEEVEAHDHDHDHARIDEGDHIFEQEFEVEGESSVMIQDLLDGISIVVSQADVDELETGEHLYLIVKAEDAAGNISRNSMEIHFD